jgi:hypothetical protein
MNGFMFAAASQIVNSSVESAGATNNPRPGPPPPRQIPTSSGTPNASPMPIRIGQYRGRAAAPGSSRSSSSVGPKL